jgi:hypothetical protein
MHTTSDGLPDVWNAACSVIAKMEGLKKLKVQLCHSAFWEVLSTYGSDVLSMYGGVDFTTGNEGFVFEPLLQISEKDMQLFVVEVDWTSGPENWDERETGFELVRVGYRDRGW